MKGIRAQVSLLLANGHPDAWHYPLQTVFEEARLVARRIDAQLASSMALLNLVISSQPDECRPENVRKQNARTLHKLLKEMTDGHQ